MVRDHDEDKKILLELWKAARDMFLRRAALRSKVEDGVKSASTQKLPRTPPKISNRS
jgi:hypothetical protein